MTNKNWFHTIMFVRGHTFSALIVQLSFLIRPGKSVTCFRIARMTLKVRRVKRIRFINQCKVYLYKSALIGLEMGMFVQPMNVRN